MTSPSWSCYRCLTTQNRAKSSALCKECREAIQQAGLCWCPRCQQAVAPVRFSAANSVCLACHAARQRKNRATNPKIRASDRKSDTAWKRANPEANRANITRWKAANPGWRNTERERLRRLERYQTDPAYREKCKAAVRAWRQR